MTEALEQTLIAYDAWLDRQLLAAKTRTAYRLQVRQYGAYLAQHPATADDPLRTPCARDYAIRDYKSYLKTERQAKPTSVNLGWQPLTTSTSLSETIDHKFSSNGCQSRRLARSNQKNKKPFCGRLSVHLPCVIGQLHTYFSTQPCASENVPRSTWMTCVSPLVRA
jgi:hypothetical protein